MPDDILSQLSSVKIVIFLLVDIVVDIFCYFYNKIMNFRYVIYYIPLKSYFIHGLYLYYVVLMSEVLLQKILMLS